MKKAFSFIFCMIFLHGYFVAQKQYDIHKTAHQIKIDGLFEEVVWQKTQIAQDFYQNFPYDTGFAQSKTFVQMTYDDQNIYLAIKCEDLIKGDFVIQSLKRDYSYPKTDAFAVFIDPFNDGQNGYSFSVSPLGVQREGLLQNGGVFGVTTSWDQKWNSAVKVFDGYWQAEMAIPFKSIRYDASALSWGINFSRNDLKRNENSAWVKVPRNFNIATLAFHAKLQWDQHPPKKNKNIAIIPYLQSSYTKDYQADTEELKPNAGLDARMAIGTGLNLDLTVNPDFSQVEVDRQVINLSRFSLFFPERRQFFTENSDLFANFGFTKIRPFFSRNIGLQFDSTTFSMRQIPLYYGARLSGKVGKNWRIGVMSTQSASDQTSGIDAQNYSVLAVQRKIFKRSNIAFIAINRQSNASDYGRILGLDYNLASADGRFIGKAFYHHSFKPNLTNKAFANATWLTYADQNWSISWNHEHVTENYRADVGFVPRASLFDPTQNQNINIGYVRLEPSIYRKWYPKSTLINKITLGTYYSDYMNERLESNDRINELSGGILFQNSADLILKAINREVLLFYDRDITFSGQTPLPMGRYSFNALSVDFTSNARRPFFYAVNTRIGQYYNGHQFTSNLSISKRFQPFVIAELNASFNRFDMPYLNQTADLTLVGFRTEVSFTKKLFLTTYLQYNTQAQNLNLNTRLQYRFKPMSDLFIVYGDNYNEQFSIKNRALIVKLNYWFSL